MSRDHKSISDAKAVMARYERYGSLVGFGVGLIGGVVLAGPYFHEWSLAKTVWTVIGCSMGGALLGYFADAIAIGSVVGGAGGVGFGDDSGHRSGDHSGSGRDDGQDGAGGGVG